MGAPILRAEIDIDAPVSKVWAMITDLRRMPEWSPQTVLMKPLGAVRPGTRTVNFNRRNLLVWPTTSTITELVPESRFAFRVNTNNTIWSYELEPRGEGTRLVETRNAEDGIKPLSTFLTDKLMGGVPSFESELLEGMNASLARIKDAAERG